MYLRVKNESIHFYSVTPAKALPMFLSSPPGRDKLLTPPAAFFFFFFFLKFYFLPAIKRGEVRGNNDYITLPMFAVFRYFVLIQFRSEKQYMLLYTASRSTIIFIQIVVYTILADVNGIAMS